MYVLQSANRVDGDGEVVQRRYDPADIQKLEWRPFRLRSRDAGGLGRSRGESLQTNTLEVGGRARAIASDGRNSTSRTCA